MFSEYARNALRMAALMGQRGDLRVHPRLHRPRGGRSDPSGRGADRDVAADAEPVGVAALRRGGVDGRMEGGDRAPGRADESPVLAPEPSPSVAHRRADRGHPARRGTCCAKAATRSSSPPARRSGLRWAPPPSSPTRASRRGWCRCRARTCSTRRTRPTANRCCRARCGHGGRGGGRGSPPAGAPTWARTARSPGFDSFGKSAPYQDLYEHFGLTAGNVAAMVESVIAGTGTSARA